MKFIFILIHFFFIQFFFNFLFQITHLYLSRHHNSNLLVHIFCFHQIKMLSLERLHRSKLILRPPAVFDDCIAPTCVFQNLKNPLFQSVPGISSKAKIT